MLGRPNYLGHKRKTFLPSVVNKHRTARHSANEHGLILTSEPHPGKNACQGLAAEMVPGELQLILKRGQRWEETGVATARGISSSTGTTQAPGFVFPQPDG